MTPLIYAAYNGHTEIVQLLLSNPNIDINCKNVLIWKHLYHSNLIFLWYSSFYHFWNLIWKFNYTPLIVASSIGYTEIVKLLLSQSGIEINCKDILTETNS